MAVFGSPARHRGHRFAETRRPAPSIADLTDREAAAAGVVAAVPARGLRAEPGVAPVHTAVAGRAIAPYHQHVIARTVGTPADIPWHASDDRDGAHRGDDAAATAER